MDFPQSNCKAEIGVESVKQIITDNTTPQWQPWHRLPAACRPPISKHTWSKHAAAPCTVRFQKAHQGLRSNPAWPLSTTPYLEWHLSHERGSSEKPPQESCREMVWREMVWSPWSPEFNFSATFVNNQQVCISPSGILNLVMFISILICHCLFALVLKRPDGEWPITYTFTFYIYITCKATRLPTPSSDSPRPHKPQPKVMCPSPTT